MSVLYCHAAAEPGDFCCEVDQTGRLISLSHRDDPYHMNWVEGKQPWGTVACPKELDVCVERSFTKYGTMKERYVFCNRTAFDLFLQKGDVGIYTTWNDNYQEAQTCMTSRCHTHIWCSGSASCVMALRMGGKGPHLGLVLTEGSLCAYSVERDPAQSSNDRGDFILHPSPTQLEPDAAFVVEWELFWFHDREEFEAICRRYDSYAAISASEFTLFAGETLCFEVDVPVGTELQIAAPEGSCAVSKTASQDGRDRYQVTAAALTVGEQTFEITYGSRKTWARFLVVPPIEQLVRARCRYIAQKQQYHNPKSHLDGAYLIYDAEEQDVYYSYEYDHNGGRERIGMGALMACFLQCCPDEELQKSLNAYREYVVRELFDPESGEVFNDAQRNQDWNRLYNYPLAAVFFMELYRLTKDQTDLTYMYRAMKSYYAQGGTGFYAICIPMEESIQLLRDAGRLDEAESLLRDYCAHGDVIRQNGTNYPPHEVKFEQSIVSPAAIYMQQLYRLTDREEYLKAVKEQLAVLSLFDGGQPDYHLHQVAIRHWDGYWFGKRRCYGDTFPHYWSALSGVAYSMSDEAMYRGKAEASLRGCLSMFFPDGSATCAYVYPFSVNGVKADYADPWANDQDWALYFYLIADCKSRRK